ncbi:MAG: lysylphosphatidylglycerol synthase domain-containing protein [Pseudohongiellaceae bacterium]
MRLLKFVSALFILFLLFYFSILSLDALLIFIDNLTFLSIVGLAVLSSFLLIGTYFRWYFCTKLLSFSIPKRRIFRESAEAYTFGQIIPGQLGIDGWRILKLKEFDESSYKKRLLAATIIEKIVALIGQMTILGIFLAILFHTYIDIAFSDVVITITLMSCTFLLLSKIVKYFINNKLGISIESKLAWPIVGLYIYSVSLNLLACCVLFIISKVILNTGSLSFVATSTAMIASNLSAAIPLTPNGLGLAEFVYAKVLVVVGDSTKIDLYGTTYFIYRLCNALGHVLLYSFSLILGSIDRNVIYET